MPFKGLGVAAMDLRRLAAGLLPLVALAYGPSARAEWLEVKSAHFTLTGDLDEATLRRRAERLERFDATIRQIIPKSIESNLPVMVTNSVDEVRAIGHRSSGTLAFFAPSPYGVFAVTPESVNNGYGVSAEMVMFHEYVHHMLMGSLDDPMPRWMNEGMAELFMNTRLENDGAVTIGLGNSARGYSLNRLGRWTVERMFESDRLPPSEGDVDQLYAKGWLFLHYCLFSGKRSGQFAAFAELLKKGVPQIDAARQAFGDLDKLEAELEFYRGRNALPALRIAADKLHELAAVAVRRLSPGEAEMMPMRRRSMGGVTAAEALALAARARPVAAKFPDSAFAQRAMSEMEYDAKNYDAADSAIDLALKADSQFVDAMAFKGLLVGARALREKKPELWREARSWIVRANRAQPDNPFPLALYFDSFTAAGQAPPQAALNGLLRAIQLQPSYLGLRTKAAVQLLNTDATKDARFVLAPAALAPHSKADNPLAKLLASIDANEDKTAMASKITALKLGDANLFAQPEPPKPGKDGEAKKDYRAVHSQMLVDIAEPATPNKRVH